jgi:hypothetical protein
MRCWPAWTSASTSSGPSGRHQHDEYLAEFRCAGRITLRAKPLLCIRVEEYVRRNSRAIACNEQWFMVEVDVRTPAPEGLPGFPHDLRTHIRQDAQTVSGQAQLTRAVSACQGLTGQVIQNRTGRGGDTAGFQAGSEQVPNLLLGPASRNCLDSVKGLTSSLTPRPALTPSSTEVS